MKINDIPKEELELMGYDDLAYMILKEEKEKMKINDLFGRICKMLDLSQSEFENKIADFFGILTTDKRFIMLEDGNWDLKDRHSEKVVIDEEEEDFVEETDEEETEEDKDDNIYDEEEEDNSRDEDLKDLVIIDGDEEEESL